MCGFIGFKGLGVGAFEGVRAGSRMKAWRVRSRYREIGFRGFRLREQAFFGSRIVLVGGFVLLSPAPPPPRFL